MPDYGTSVNPPTTHLSIANPTNSQSIKVWPAFTDLIQDDNGSYKQTRQISEINNFLGGVVKRANSNLVLVNSFPDPEQQEQWLVNALNSELAAKNGNHVINAVGERAMADANYFNRLLSMVMLIQIGAHSLLLIILHQTRNRWSGYRQTALKVARDLVGTQSKGGSAQRANEQLDETANEKAQIKSAYGLSGSNAEMAAAAAELLDHEAFHYGRTNAVRWHPRPQALVST